jgi:tRNA nucleotidyltransferase (CCA-adding enzyme)
MSDYMFMLESHLSTDQNRVLEQVQAAAGAAGVSLFLTGGAMRDMLGGFRIRDLDFSVEGNALKLVRELEEKAGAQTTSVDENRRVAEMLFPGGVRAQVAMARQERYGRSGSKPQIAPATIQEDLRGRDFTINAMALSLNRASRGLLLDPTNGLADLGRHEMVATHPSIFTEDPTRIPRLVRLKIRVGFTVEERTQAQYEAARAAHLENLVPARVLLEELKRIAEEPSPAEVMQAFGAEGLLVLFSPVLAGPKLNLAGLSRLEKSVRLVESAGVPIGSRLDLFLHVLAAKLTPKDKAALIKATQMSKAEAAMGQALAANAKKLEQALRSPKIRKPSHVYQILYGATGDDMTFLLSHSTQKAVTERIRNYLQKYLPVMQEVPPSEWAALEGAPGSPKYQRSRQAMVASHLDVRPKPVEEEAPPPAPMPVEFAGRGRRG